MAEQGIPLQVTQDLVGHVSDAVTKHYTHISENAKRLAVEKLNTLRQVGNFVDVLVDEAPKSETVASKLLN
jgi:hypothetical protein